MAGIRRCDERIPPKAEENPVPGPAYQLIIKMF
jgi:hypothetical protein